MKRDRQSALMRIIARHLRWCALESPRPVNIKYATSWVSAFGGVLSEVAKWVDYPHAHAFFAGMTEDEIRMALLFIAEAIDNP